MREKILVVDDEQGILNIIGGVLTHEDYSVKLINDANKIFEYIESFDPDLILLDISLNELDGREICNDLKKKGKTSHIPVIMISGTYDLASALRTNCAPDAFVEKPIDMRILVSKIAELLSPSIDMQ